MSKSIFIAAATLIAAATFTSCNVNDEINVSENQPVSFMAAIGGTATPQTLAAGTTWAATDKIGIFMMQSGSAIESNKQYNLSDATTGAFTAETGNEMYYPIDGSAVDFIAYYPYASGTALTTPLDIVIATDQNGEDIQSTFDLLYATADNTGNGYTKSNGATPVALAFNHMLSKLVMNCKANANIGISDFNNVKVTIRGMNTKNTFNLSTGMFGTSNSNNNITPRKITAATGFSASYDAIIMPGSYAKNVVTVEFTVGNDIYTWKVDPVSPASSVNFAGGNEYTYAVTLTRTGLEVTGSISPWQAVSRGNVTAE